MYKKLLILAVAAALTSPSVASAKKRPTKRRAKVQPRVAAPPSTPSRCPTGATWKRVDDESPMSKCRPRPLEEGCSLSDGRKHGPWTIMDRATACRLPASKAHYVNGRRQGVETIWRSDCKHKPCTAFKAEEGPWAGDHRHGIWTIFKQAGGVAERGNWFDGKQHGPWLVYSDDGLTVSTVCYQADKVAWRGEPTPVGKSDAAPQPLKAPCPTVIKKRDDDGTKNVSAAEQKASRLVRNAQATTIPKLRVLYLRKAVGLVPGNKHYRTLLEAAQREQAKPSP